VSNNPTRAAASTAMAETPPGQPAGAPPDPPVARRIPSERTHHGDTVIDEYAWLADADDPETLRYLEAENAYTAAMTSGQAGLREAIFGEIKGRTQETDLSVPVRKNGWWYYSRTIAGKQYPVHCRRAVQPGEDAPPVTDDGAPLPGEEILLDGNEVAGDSPFFSLGAFRVSPDGRLLAYSTDFAGDERFTLRVKDLVTGETAADEIPGTFYGCAWSLDGASLFYTTVDAAWRPYRVWRHRVGTPATDDQVVIEEEDQRFNVGVGLSRSERYVTIVISSSLTSEVWLLDAAGPEAAPRVVLPRRPGVEYSVEHQGGPDGAGRLLILHNDGALNFELAQAPLAGPTQAGEDADGGPIASRADLTTVIAHRADTRLLGVDAFAGHVVVHFRRDGLTGLRILRTDGSEQELAFPEPLYQVFPGSNPEYATQQLRLHYASLATPDSVLDADTTTGELTLRKRRPVLALPGQGSYDPAAHSRRCS